MSKRKLKAPNLRYPPVAVPLELVAILEPWQGETAEDYGLRLLLHVHPHKQPSLSLSPGGEAWLEKACPGPAMFSVTPLIGYSDHINDPHPNELMSHAERCALSDLAGEIVENDRPLTNKELAQRHDAAMRRANAS